MEGKGNFKAKSDTSACAWYTSIVGGYLKCGEERDGERAFTPLQLAMRKNGSKRIVLKNHQSIWNNWSCM